MGGANVGRTFNLLFPLSESESVLTHSGPFTQTVKQKPKDEFNRLGQNIAPTPAVL